MSNQVIQALFFNGYITTGASLAPRMPKACTISIEEANECTDNYSKKLDTNENPYYYIESDYLESEGLYNAPGLDTYDSKTGKPIVKPYATLEYNWLMRKACKV